MSILDTAEQATSLLGSVKFVGSWGEPTPRKT